MSTTLFNCCKPFKWYLIIVLYPLSLSLCLSVSHLAPLCSLTPCLSSALAYYSPLNLPLSYRAVFDVTSVYFSGVFFLFGVCSLSLFLFSFGIYTHTHRIVPIWFFESFIYLLLVAYVCYRFVQRVTNNNRTLMWDQYSVHDFIQFHIDNNVIFGKLYSILSLPFIVVWLVFFLFFFVSKFP